MQTRKTSVALKAQARENLLGNYNTVILAYIIIQFITSGCLSLVEAQSDFHSISGNAIYLAVYLIVSLFLAVFSAGQNRMYVKLSKAEPIAVRDIWYAFRTLADKCMILQILIAIRLFLWSIPCMVCVLAVVITGNYYLSLLIAISFILFCVMATITLLTYSQVFFLISDHPNATVSEIMNMSKSLMQGQKARLFYLIVSFTGVFLLVLLTFGLGSLWATPYILATRAGFYLNITGQDQLLDIDTASETASTDQQPKINLTV